MGPGMSLSDQHPEIGSLSARSGWVRIGTLVLLRWVAVIGQLGAIIAAERFYFIDLPLGACLAVVGAAVALNLVSILVFPSATRLSETGTMLMLLFDIGQIGVLLYLTGGHENPFALLMIVPVTVSATVLNRSSTLVLGSVAVLIVVYLHFRHLPLQTVDGIAYHMPDYFQVGNLLAILIGMVFLGAYAHRIARETHAMADALTATQLALAREQKLTDLAGVVAATAHELGTPLATIKLISSELIEDFDDWPELRADARLIGEQADRCRDILRSMGRAGKDDLLVRSAPLAEVLREAAEPHLDRGREIEFRLAPAAGAEARQPAILRRPEVIHGLRNLVQNAVDFASAKVVIGAEWSDAEITLRFVDDGPGFPTGLLGRIGDPFLRARDPAPGEDARPGYEGMGLGLFIAKTLLERSGARLAFANLSQASGGAVVEVRWPRAAISPEAERAGLGENRPFPA